MDVGSALQKDFIHSDVGGGPTNARSTAVSNSAKQPVGASPHVARSRGPAALSNSGSMFEIKKFPPTQRQVTPVTKGPSEPTMCGSVRPTKDKHQRVFCGRMQNCKVVHSLHREGGNCSTVLAEGNLSVCSKEPEQTLDDQRHTEQDQFHAAIDILNGMIEVDALQTDMREWVARYTEGKAGARLSKEHLRPVWILVGASFVLAVDLNGSAQHHNYKGVATLNLGEFPPEGGIVFPAQDVLRLGRLQLPQNFTGIKAMSLLLPSEVKWGVPVGILFINPAQRASIIRDICQSYLPSFLREAYPMGVQLRGGWISTASSGVAREFFVVELPKQFCESIRLSMIGQGALGISSFTGEGYQLWETERVKSPQWRSSDNVSRRNEVNASVGRMAVSRVEEQQSGVGRLTLQASEEAVRLDSPWEGSGGKPLFGGRLHVSQPATPRDPSATVCQGVLILTARGPLELLSDCVTSPVSLKDVKLSFFRSGVGRCMRLTQDSVRFMYCPNDPPLDDKHVINVRYAVIRLKTCR